MTAAWRHPVFFGCRPDRPAPCLSSPKAHVITTKEALRWTGVWISVALLFSVFIYYAYDNHWMGIGLGALQPLSGSHAALQYFTGWGIEYSLSLDNIFGLA